MCRMSKTADDPAKWQAIATRNPAYDGLFIYGVTTTGIYYRPSCPSRAKPENMTLFETAEAAKAAGFRACKRCRP